MDPAAASARCPWSCSCPPRLPSWWVQPWVPLVSRSRLPRRRAPSGGVHLHPPGLSHPPMVPLLPAPWFPARPRCAWGWPPRLIRGSDPRPPQGCRLVDTPCCLGKNHARPRRCRYIDTPAAPGGGNTCSPPIPPVIPRPPRGVHLHPPGQGVAAPAVPPSGSPWPPALVCARRPRCCRPPWSDPARPGGGIPPFLLPITPAPKPTRKP